jgi:hypothetical protein
VLDADQSVCAALAVGYHHKIQYQLSGSINVNEENAHSHVAHLPRPLATGNRIRLRIPRVSRYRRTRFAAPFARTASFISEALV